MNLIMSIYLAALFVALTPGVLVTLPKGGSKYTVLAVHAALFAVVWHFTHRAVWRMSMEGFQNNVNANVGNANVGNMNANVGNGMNANATAEGFQKKMGHK